MRRKYISSDSSGFALGMILLFIGIIAALSVMATLSSTSNDYSRGLTLSQITSFRSHTSSLVRAIQRIAQSCPRNELDDCIREIRAALTLENPGCEHDPALKKYCPFDSLYGGASRITLPPAMRDEGADSSFDIAYDVIVNEDDDETKMVLFINQLTLPACQMIEAQVIHQTNPPLINGQRLRHTGPGGAAQRLAVYRQEGCISYSNIQLGSLRLPPGVVLASFGAPVQSNQVQSSTANSIRSGQYFIVVPVAWD